MKRAMKTYGLLILGAVCILTACGTKSAPAGGEAENSQETAITIQQETSLAGEASSVQETSQAEEAGAVPAEGSEAQETGSPDLAEGQSTVLTPINLELSADYHGEWEDGKALLRSECSTIYVLDDGYEALKQAFKEYNEINCEEIKQIYDENLEWLLSPEGRENPAGEMELFIERKILITRADDRIVSLWNQESGYLGGAHGIFYEGSANFDPETGKRLSLPDIAADYDGLYETVKQMLSDNYEKKVFFEDYEETTLHPMFYGDSEEGCMPLEWTMDGEGVTFSFSPYVLAPWVEGTLSVKIPFAGHENLFVEKYQQVPARPIKNVWEEQQFLVDTDSDGTEETVWFSCDYNEAEYGGTFFICLDREGKDEEPVRIDCGGYYGGFKNAWVLKTGSGHPYLYVEFVSGNDYRNLEIYDLAAGGEVLFAHVGESWDSVYDHFIGDSDQFALYTRIHYLSSYYGYRTYSIGEDGLPVPKEEIYEIVQGPESYARSITSKRELPVTVLEDGVEKETVLPAGTVFYPERTDGVTFLEAKLEDGRLCRIHTEGSQESGGLFIDGIREDDCFEELYYVG